MPIAHDQFKLPRVTVHRGRFEPILQAASGRRVLHVGCADAGMQDLRLGQGDLLHLRLAAVTSALVGVDIDANAVAQLRAAGVSDIFVADVCDQGWSDSFAGTEFDLVLVSEVLEHVSNPGAFLSHLSEFAARHRARALFTVPSPFSADVLAKLLSNVEFVHPDHNYWFSYHTVTTLMRKHGWEIESVSAYSFADTRVVASVFAAVRGQTSPVLAAKLGARSLARIPNRLIAKWLEHRSPFFSDGLIIEAAPRTIGL